MSAPLEPIVKHDLRLDILCCLADGESLTVPQVSARTGREERLVRHHVKLLEAFCLVKKEDDAGGGQPLYVARLDEHPDWVREAVESHRQASG